MRVLQVVTSMTRAGLETMLMNYYRHIDRQHIQFDFLVHRQERKEYDDEIEFLGGKIYRLPPLNPVGYTYHKALRQFFKEHPEYRIVHVHLNCMSSVVLKEAKKAGIPVRIAHSHNTAQDKNLKYPIKMLCRRFIPRYATQLLACSQEAGRWLFGDEPFQILYNAIEVEKFRYDPQTRERMRESLGIAENTVLVGHVGAFMLQKNHDFLIDVFAQMQKQVRSKLLLVGDGYLRKKLEDKVRQLGIEDKVIFAGIRSDVSDLMQAMDVFVFPSHYEGLGIVIIEAQAAGLPCLISEQVPQKGIVTELVKQVSLNKGAEIWADDAIKISQIKRKDVSEKVRVAGYDILTNTEKLQNFYIKLSDKESKASLQ